MHHIGLVAFALPESLIAILTAAGGLVVGVFVEPIRRIARRRLAVRRRVATVERMGASLGFEASLNVPPVKISASIGETLENLARDPIDGPRIYISEIAASSFRCFEQLGVTLNHPGDGSGLAHENVNLILGNNGTGKSTLLKAVAIAALGPILDSSGFVPYHLIRSHRSEARLDGAFVLDNPDQRGPRTLRGAVDITQTGDYERLTATHDPNAWADIFEETNLSFLVLAYGVNRRVADDESDRTVLERGRRRRRYERIASLFDESAVLTPLSAWLPDLSDDRRSEVMGILARLLPDAHLADDKGEETIFRTRGQDVPYRALSDGYRSFIGWVGDLLFQIYTASDGSLPFDEVGGIVLVDEVDLLLHPEWQREVVPNIARALPKLQFVFTTHSPIVAGTLHANNILLARTREDGSSTLGRIDAQIHGLNAEQILLSSYFELESTRAPDTRDELAALAERAMNGDDDAALQYLRTLAGDPGDTEALS
jgi:AAA domain, putative AbiEii toxin, Type IV TA system